PMPSRCNPPSPSWSRRTPCISPGALSTPSSGPGPGTATGIAWHRLHRRAVHDRDPRDPLPLDGADGRSDQDLWLISYADLMTLLLAFFVMILAISRVDMGKFERLSREVNPSAEAPLATAQSRIDELIRSRGLSEVASTTYNESGLSLEVQKNVFF